MSDRDWRNAEREWQANPGDQDLLQRAIHARRRAGVPVPGWMQDQQIFPPRRLDFAVPTSVLISTPAGRPKDVGRTPAGGQGLGLPEHRAWWAQPDMPSDAGLEALAGELAQEEAPGLGLRPDVSDAGLAHLTGLTNLRRLDLGGCGRLTDAGLANLTGLRSLAWLNLWYCAQLTDAGLAHLDGLTNLIHLDLGGWSKLTDDGLAPVAGMPELYVLSLHGCAKLGDDALSHLAGLDRLAALDLRKWSELTDAGLAHLAGLKELTLLNLSFCPQLTADGLQHLTGLKNLSQLLIVGSGEATKRAKKVLAEALPRCEVVV